jgi:hypothetical protein
MENQMRQAGVRKKKKNTQDQETSPAKPQKSLSDPSTGNAERDNAIRDTARKFTVMTNLFPVTEWFMAPLPANFTLDATRYDTDESKLNANILELYEEVPQSLHEALLKTTSFRQVVSDLSPQPTQCIGIDKLDVLVHSRTECSCAHHDFWPSRWNWSRSV